MYALCPSKLTPKGIAKTNECMHPPKGIYKNVHYILIQSRVKIWRQPKCPATFYKWVNKMWYNHITENYSAMKKNKVLLCVNRGEIHWHNVEQKKADTKEYMLNDSIYMHSRTNKTHLRWQVRTMVNFRVEHEVSLLRYQ